MCISLWLKLPFFLLFFLLFLLIIFSSQRHHHHRRCGRHRRSFPIFSMYFNIVCLFLVFSTTHNVVFCRYNCFRCCCVFIFDLLIHCIFNVYPTDSSFFFRFYCHQPKTKPSKKYKQRIKNLIQHSMNTPNT